MVSRLVWIVLGFLNGGYVRDIKRFIFMVFVF